MTHREVVNRILAYHPDLGADYNGCDNWKAGDPDRECTGVTTALVANIGVIRRTIELGANLIIVHEPTFYTSADGAGWFEDFPNSVYEEKRRLIDEHGIAIWRDHDHMHAHDPDGIFTGVIKYLGWEGHCKVDNSSGVFAHFLIDFPETTLGELCRHVVDTIGINGLRYIGDPSAHVSSLAMVGHIMPMSRPRSDGGRPVEYGVQMIDLLERQVDVIMPGETIDWTVLSYLRDAVQLGRAKGMIHVGHFNWEELGMKYAQEWISGLVPELEVTYVPSGDMYGFVTR